MTSTEAAKPGNIPTEPADPVSSTYVLDFRLKPDDPDLPKIVSTPTTCSEDMCAYSFMTPLAIYRELDPINATAASLYVVIGRAGWRGTGSVDLVRDVFWQLAWFHNWADNSEALADVLVAAALLERHGWLSREQLPDGGERWTVLGRDRPRWANSGEVAPSAHSVA